MRPKTAQSAGPAILAGLLAALLAAALLALAVLAPTPAEAKPRFNHAPVARDNSYSLDEDAVFTVGRFGGVLNNDHDRENNRLFAKLVRATHSGRITLAKDGSLSYDPNANHNGGDFATYRACEAKRPQKCSPLRTIRFHIAPVNDAPVAQDNHYYLYEGQSKTYAAPSVLGNDTDGDGDALTVAGHTGSSPKVRVFLNDGGSLRIVAGENAAGRYSFTYRAADPGGLTDTATVTFRVRNR